MMKKFLFFAVLAFTVMAGLTLTSCGGGNDEPKVDAVATGQYDIAISQDLLEVADVFIYYKGNDNANKMAQVKSTTWTKTVTSKRFPVELGVKYSFVLKDEPKTKTYYNLMLKVSISGSVNTGGNFQNSSTVLSYDALQADKVDGAVKGKSGQSFGYTIDKNGNPSPNGKLNYDI